MKKLLFFFLLFTAVNNCFASNNWTVNYLGQPINLRALHFINENTGFIVANGYFMKTSNGGVNWNISTSRFNLQKVYFLNNQTGFVVGISNDSSFILKTTNTGIAWNSYFLRTTESYFEYGNISFKNDNTGYLVYPSINGGYYRTTNNGTFWVLRSFTNEHTRDVKWIGDSLYRIGSQSNSGLRPVYYTSTDEQEWRTGMICSECSGERGVSIFVFDTVRYWHTEQTYPLFRRSTWYFPAWQYMSGLSFPASYSFDDPKYIHYGYSQSPNTRIYSSSNSGFSWNVDTLLDFEVHGMQFVNTQIGYCIGNNGLIAKTTNGGGVIGIVQISNLLPDKFSLNQNYPNPFNPVTNITFNVKNKENVKLTIYDALGREVAILLNEVLQAGSYKIDWDARDYTSGIYLYKLETKNFSETKKMILLK